MNCLLDTNNLEPISGVTVDEILALNLDGRDGMGGRREGASGRQQASMELCRSVCCEIQIVSDDPHRDHFEAKRSGINNGE